MKQQSIHQVWGDHTSWKKTFALLPYRTISNRRVWLTQVYIREVWVYTGTSELKTEKQYGELFDILVNS